MPSRVINVLEQALNAILPVNKIWVAYSGGLDSHVLLHALKRLQNCYGFLLGALYVNHGVNVNADHWADHCVQVCQALAINCQVLKIQLPSCGKRNWEEIARNARYEAFKTSMEADHYLAVAHHEDDQAETFLLQLLRGAGTRGLSAMPVIKALESGFLWRPLLSLSRDVLIAYATEYQLAWIEDDSNVDTHFDRNYLRHQVMPQLKARWPHVAGAIGQSAKHCAEAELVIEEVALEDLRGVEAGSTLNLSKLCLLSPVRRHHVLRFWLKQQGFSLPSRVHLRQFEECFMKARQDANPVLCFANVQLRRHFNRLYALPNFYTPHPPRANDARADLSPKGRGEAHSKFCGETSLCRDSVKWKLDEPLLLPGVGKLVAEQRRGEGICSHWVGDENIVEIRFRQGGEVIKPVNKCTRKLKKWLQDWKIPPWERERIPLIYINNELAQVLLTPDNAIIASKFIARPDEMGWRVARG